MQGDCKTGGEVGKNADQPSCCGAGDGTAAGSTGRGRAAEDRTADERTPERVALAPLLVASGMHAAREIAGDSEESWKSRFERAGYSVKCIMRGLGEYAGIRRIYVRHAKEAEERAGSGKKRQNPQK